MAWTLLTRATSEPLGKERGEERRGEERRGEERRGEERERERKGGDEITIKTEPSNVRLSEHCDSHGSSTLPGTHGSSTLPFTRSFRTCEADKETVDGDTAGYNHPQQQHEHHESVPDPLFDRAEIQAATFIPNTPKTR
ncbi:hypothetical protein D4764_09G0010310 [Takifugu flavidus]|uniref:Uncharacterized protein n=1 Tax=Takifugu flavidus TaxID=433684 RepID=A0A5C6MP54_9TELE|nr:hypothetical protein D4764_09G0010310 [Takifugu flavidus]